MAKFCPIIKGPVTYLTCMECDDKECVKNDTQNHIKIKEKERKNSYEKEN